MLQSLLLFVILINVSESTDSGSTSFDSLIATQCRARCLSLYPWKLLNNSTSTTILDMKHRSFRNKRVSLLYYYYYKTVHISCHTVVYSADLLNSNSLGLLFFFVKYIYFKD